jgi:hypothetical protein
MGFFEEQHIIGRKQHRRFERSIVSAEWGDDGRVVYWFRPVENVDPDVLIADALIKDNDVSRIECFVDDRLDVVYVHLGGGYWEAWR